MAVTIEDVAREANVSIATVSRVMNNTKAVSPELRERVFSAIRKTSFRPNVLARGLITNRTYTIGVVISDISNPVFGVLTKGINSVCQDRGYTVVICESDGKRKKELALLEKLAEQRIDGLLFAGVDVNRELIDRMLCLDYPVVLVTQEESYGENRMMTVSHDNQRATFDAIDFLVSCGHRRIAFIGGPVNDYSSGEKRLEGYRLAMAKHGLETPGTYIEHGDFSFDAGFSGMKRIYEESEKLPTAVMACSDLMAIGAMQCARNMGLSIPEDVSFMGFDDSELARYSTPALSTVRISYYDEGVLAAEELFRSMDSENGEETNIRYIPHKIIRRGSVNCLRAATGNPTA